MHEKLANSTFQVVCGESAGSGFSFRDRQVVVTNCHVIRPAFERGLGIKVVTEQGFEIPAKMLRYSDETAFDFAILHLRYPLPEGRHILNPIAERVGSRGHRVAFAGYPHGIPDLLVHEAIISGPFSTHGFYIDGAVNGGNSGGPIISLQSGEVIGIITQRRFLGGPDLDSMAKDIGKLARQAEQAAVAGASAKIMGVDVGGLVKMTSTSLNAVSQVIKANANVGIGIGFHIEYANAAYRELGLP